MSIRNISNYLESRHLVSNKILSSLFMYIVSWFIDTYTFVRKSSKIVGNPYKMWLEFIKRMRIIFARLRIKNMPDHSFIHAEM